jgi:hypothetical protein
MPRFLLLLSMPLVALVARAQCSDQWLVPDPAFTTNGLVCALELWDPDGPGPQAEILIVAGSFSSAGGASVSNIAAWDGTHWLPLGPGTNGRVQSLATLNGEVFASGYFTAAGNTPAQNVAAWNGVTWRALDLIWPFGVTSLAVYHGALYATRGSIAGAEPPLYRRDDPDWVAIIPPWPCLGATAVVVYGDSLVVGGPGPYWTTATVAVVAGPAIPDPRFPGEYQFPVVWSLSADAPWMVVDGNIDGHSAICDGRDWTIPGFSSYNSGITAVASFHGRAIVGGGFSRVGATEANNIAWWNGTSASAMGSGIIGNPGYVAALHSSNDRLLIGGSFTSAGGLPVSNLAIWGPAPDCYPNCDCSSAAPLLNTSDFICFLNKYAAFDPYANCDASTAPPTLNVADFICFMNKFAAGCP